MKIKSLIKRNLDNNSGQLFLMGGVIITLLIIGLAVVSTSLSEVTTEYKKENYLRDEYVNIRNEFGVALQDRIESKFNYVFLGNDQIIQTYFEKIRDEFVFVEKLHGYNFNAEYVDCFYTTGDKVESVSIKLILSNGEDSVSEIVNYDISGV